VPWAAEFVGVAKWAQKLNFKLKGKKKCDLLCLTSIKLVSQMKRNSINDYFFKFAISVGQPLRLLSPWKPKTLVMPPHLKTRVIMLENST